MELLILGFTVAFSVLIVLVVVKFQRRPDDDDDDDGDATSKHREEDSRKSSGKKVKKPSHGKHFHGNKQGNVDSETDKEISAKQQQENRPKNDKDNTKTPTSNLQTSEEPLNKREVPLTSTENSDIRKRKGNATKKMAIQEENEENNENHDNAETDVADLVARAMNAEKKLVISDKKISELSSRIKDYEIQIHETERRLLKAKEDDVTKALRDQASKLKSVHDTDVRKLETQLREFKQKCDNAVNDKLILQNEVAENARRKLMLEKEISDLKKNASGGSNEQHDVLLKELHHSLPDFNPKSPRTLKESLQKYGRNAKKRAESESEKIISTLKLTVSEKEAQLVNLRHEAEGNLQSLRNKMETELNMEKNRFSELQDRLQKVEEENISKIASFTRKVEELDMSRQELVVRISHMETDLKTKTELIDRLGMEKAQFERQIHDLASSNSSGNERLHEFITKIDQLNSDLDNLRCARDHLAAEKDQFGKQCDLLSQENESLKKECDSLQHQSINTENGMKAKFDEVTYQLEECRREFESLKGSSEDLSSHLEKARADIAEKDRIIVENQKLHSEEVHNLNQQLASHKVKIEEMQKETERCNNVIYEKEQALSLLQNNSKELAEKLIQELGMLKEKLEAREKELDSVNCQLTERSSEIDSLKLSVENTSQAADDSKSKLQAKLEKIEAEMAEKLQENEELRKSLSTVDAEKLDSEKKCEEKDAEIEDLRRILSEKSEHESHLQEKVNEIDDLRKQLQDKDDAESRIRSEKEDLDRSLDSLKKSFECLQQEIEKERNINNDLTSKNHSLVGKIEDVEKEIREFGQVRAEMDGLKKYVDGLSAELASEKYRVQESSEARDILERTASLLEVQLREVESNLTDTKAMYSHEVNQLRARLETLTAELNEERQMVTKLRSENDASENCANSKISKLENGAAHPFAENGNGPENSDEVGYLRDELTKAKLANSHAEEALLALQEELNVAMNKVLKMESDHSEFQSLIHTGEEALKSEQMRCEELQRKVADLTPCQ